MTFGRFVVAVLITCGTDPAFAAPHQWQRLEALEDLRFERPRVLSAQGAEPVRIALPTAWSGLGGSWSQATVGPGWIRFEREAAPPRLDLDGRPLPGESPIRGPRLDLLSGPSVNSAAPVLLQEAPAGLALRWTRLDWPGGRATVELLLPHGAAPRVQYLHLSGDARRRLLDGELRAGALEGRTELALLPDSAQAWRLGADPVSGIGPAPEPAADGPPPAGCDPVAGSWCDEAGGAVSILLAENFDDGMSAARGWTASGEWTETAHADCAPGASADPGRAWHFGDTASCSYSRNSSGDLLSPAFGPVTASTVFTFSFRLDMEQCGFPFTCEEALVLVNGTPQWSLADPGDPASWFNLQQLDLSPWAGQMVTIGFRFTSDNGDQRTGWFVDDVIAWDTAVGRPNCVIAARGGGAGLSGCADTVNTQWSFNEQAFCEGCSYTFYALVECGREMHLPLRDMEGADVTVTDMLTGLPVPLTCRNETARADAGEIPYPVVISGDCCPGGGDEAWWGPAFDETDNAGPGRVSWGFPDCPSLLVYDANGDGSVDCAELPGCGGELDQLTPGENQVMDCSIADVSGLCGIYRIDVVSGGFVWDLFANCDGTSAPQFPIYHDCTDAWAAWDPLPELAVANLTVDDGCPDLTADFTIANLGCADHPGDVTVRLVSDCVPADTADHVVPGPFPAGGSVPVSLPFTASCSPVRIEVFVDPDDAVSECTESPTAAACNAEAGVDSLADFSCGCTAALSADAGAGPVACDGQGVLLDGSASTIAPCAQPLYRWLDAGGGVVRDWDPDPTASVAVSNCPTGASYTLEVSCQGEPCVDSASVDVGCFAPTPAAGGDQRLCIGATAVLDGSASLLPGCAAGEYRWLAPDLSVARDWSADPVLDLGPMDCTLSGDWTLELRCPALGSCSDSATVRLDCVGLAVDVVPTELRACEGEDALVLPSDVATVATNCAAVEYRWRDALTGGVLVDWSPDASLSASFGACPAAADLLLEARCAEPGAPACTTGDTLTLICPKPAAPVPAASALCSGPSADLSCGVAEPGVAYYWDLDTSVDEDGNGDPADDAELFGCDLVADFGSAGRRTVRAWAQEPSASCLAFADFEVEVFEAPAPPVPSAAPACPGSAATLSCGPEDPSLAYRWDYDPSVDADGDGDPANDGDAAGCEQSPVFGAGDHQVAVTAEDARGCALTVLLDFSVAADAAPPAVAQLRLRRSGAGLDFEWDASAGAASYRLQRGTLGDWYSHGADDAAGTGACDTAGATTWSDPDDAAAGLDAYYLATALSPCGGESAAGSDSLGVLRPARQPSAACP